MPLEAKLFQNKPVGPTPDPIPTPDPVNPVIVITGLPADSVIYGDSVKFSWNIKNYVSANLNGTEIKASDSKSTGRLLNDTTYEIKAVGPYGGTADTSFTIKVKDWKSSKFGLISHSYWNIISEGYKIDTMSDYSMTDSLNLNQWILDQKWYFNSDGSFVIQSTDPDYTTINSSWELLPGDTIFIHPGNKLKLFKLDTTELVLVKKGTALVYGKTLPCKYKTVYIHGKD